MPRFNVTYTSSIIVPSMDTLQKGSHISKQRRNMKIFLDLTIESALQNLDKNKWMH